MNSNKLITESVSIFRDNLSSIMTAVQYKKVDVVIECRGRPACVLIKYEDYLRYVDK